MKETNQQSSIFTILSMKAMAESLLCRSLTPVVSLKCLCNALLFLKMPISSWSVSRLTMPRCCHIFATLITRLGRPVATVYPSCSWEQRLTYVNKIQRQRPLSRRKSFLSIRRHLDVKEILRLARKMINTTKTSEIASKRPLAWLCCRNTLSCWTILIDSKSLIQLSRKYNSRQFF